jgi:hypothetical protein
MKRGKPTVDDITALEKKLEQDIYSNLFREFEDEERYYELEIADKLNLPVEFRDSGLIVPTGRDMVDTYVDHIDIANAKVWTNPHSATNIDQKSAELLRKFGLGIIYITNVENEISPWRVLAKHFALHGLGVMKTTWEADRWPDKPIQGDDESEQHYADRIKEWEGETHQSIPIMIEAVHPRCIMADPTKGGGQYVIEKHKALTIDVAKMWPHWRNSKDRGASDEVEYIEYWDDTWRSIIVDGDPVLKIKGGVVRHKYGFIPYVLTNSGLGNYSWQGKIAMRYVGMIRYMKDLLVAESRNFSMSDIILRKSAWPWGVIKSDADIAGLDQRYGTWSVVPKDTEIQPMLPEVPPNALREFLFTIADYIGAHAGPRSVRGLSETGVRSGTDRERIINEASARYRYSTQAFKYSTSKILINCARLFKNVIPGSVRVWARTPFTDFDEIIKKDELREPFTFTVEFAPISELDEYRRHDDLERMIASGIGNIPWARQQTSNMDVDLMEKLDFKERLRNDPMVQQFISQSVIIPKFAEAFAQRAAAEGMTGQGQPAQEEAGRRMIPPQPNRAAPGSPEELQNMMAQNRSQVPMNPTQGQGGGGWRP